MKLIVLNGGQRRLWGESLKTQAAFARSQEYHLQSENEARLYRTIFETIGDGLILCDVESGRVVEANPAAGLLHGYAREDFIGLPVTAYLHPDSYAQFNASVEAVRAGKTFEATSVHIRRDGTPVTVEVRESGCTYHDRLCLLSVVRDVSARVQGEMLLRQQVAARTQEQATLLEISRTLASTLELKPDLILDQLGVIIDYTHAVLFGLEELDLVALAVRGPQWLEQAMPLRIRLDGQPALVGVLNGHWPQRIADVCSDDPAAQFLRSFLEDQAPVLLEGVRCWLWIPLAVKGEAIGGMSIGHADPDALTPHQANLALAVANQAAIALVNAQLYDQAQSIATFQERQRLAQDLHDAVNQSLFSASLIAEVLPRLWERNPEEGRQSLEDLRRLTRGAMAEMRGLLAELRPLVLTDSELGDLLRQLGDAFTGRTDVPVSFSVTGQGVLPADVQVALYRLCQEALSNIAKHAGAGQVEIDLQHDAGVITLHIRDDGCGFNPAQVPSGRQGLSIMRERAEAVGAHLSVTSRPGHGAEIRIRWREAPQQEAL